MPRRRKRAGRTARHDRRDSTRGVRIHVADASLALREPGLAIRGEVCTFRSFTEMNRRSLTPRVRAALRRLAAGPQDMRDEALLREINDEMKKLSVEDIAYVRDRVRFSCPPCPMVQSVVLMLNGLIEVKNLNL